MGIYGSYNGHSNHGNAIDYDKYCGHSDHSNYISHSGLGDYNNHSNQRVYGNLTVVCVYYFLLIKISTILCINRSYDVDLFIVRRGPWLNFLDFSKSVLTTF